MTQWATSPSGRSASPQFTTALGASERAKGAVHRLREALAGAAMTFSRREWTRGAIERLRDSAPSMLQAGYATMQKLAQMVYLELGCAVALYFRGRCAPDCSDAKEPPALGFQVKGINVAS